jgi:predicted RNA-binding Zn ribbon-like protein
MSNESAPRAWVLPDEPVAVRLMSTIWADTEGLHDDLRSPQDVDEWLDAAHIRREDVPATVEELASARGLRDALRRLAAHVTADSRPAAASATTTLEDAIRHVNAVAVRSPASVLTRHGERLGVGTQPGVSPVTAGLAGVAEDAIQLLAGDDAASLRACHAPGCVLYFVKTHPRRQWCSVACGNRARAARHYQRSKTRQ